MRVVIVTVYKSPNSGSFLQAWALYNYFEKNGFESYFLESGTRKPFFSAMRRCVSLLLKGQVKAIKNVIIQTCNFSKSTKEFKTLTLGDISQDDIFVLGSDEIWNLNRPEMAKYDIFWGEGLYRERTISYAPSINGADVSRYIQNNFVKKSLDTLHCISVRDEYSRGIISTVTNKPVQLVCDPTVLIDIEMYLDRETKVVDEEYILVYIPNAIVNDKDKELIRKFAKSVNLPLFSFHYYNDWCDRIIPADDKQFLEYIHKASVIITTTFHGATFSIIYNKNFIAYDKGSSKLSELLKTYRLENRWFKPSVNTIDDMLELYESKIEYVSVNARLNENRSIGRNYLKKNIDELQNSK